MKTSALALAASLALVLGVPTIVWADSATAESQSDSVTPLPPHRPKHVAHVRPAQPTHSARHLARDTHVAALGRMAQQAAAGAFYRDATSAGSVSAATGSAGGIAPYYGAAVLLGVGY